jgi:hypothetical protein
LLHREKPTMMRRQKEVLILILTFLIGALTNVATGSLPEEWKPYLWLSWVPLSVCLVVIIGLQFVRERGEPSDDEERPQSAGTKTMQVAGTVQADSMASESTATGVNIENLTATTAYIYQPATTALTPQEQRNRRAMLTKVKTIWIDGLLEQPLAKKLRIALNLIEQPDAVDLPLNALVQELNRPPHTLPAGTPIIDVFDKMGGTLLILAAPGAGKTTLLLELARDLIARAEPDEAHPIPVVFNLSSWAAERRALKDWLVEELTTKYDVPRKLAQMWMDADVVLPLLDGLDEVAAEQRSNCAEAINIYRQEHGLVPVAVCSRVADYQVLTTKLRLQDAIVVQPLTQEQIGDYLERAGEKLVGVRAALRDDRELAEMLDTPLMLSIVVLAYAEKSAAEILTRGKTYDRRRHLFDAYIATMFKRRSEEMRYAEQQTTHWLSWLARKMVEHSQTVLYIERMQPKWLPRSRRLWFAIRVGLLSALVGGLLVGLLVGLVYGLRGGPRSGLVYGLGVGLQEGLLGALLGALLGGLSSYPAEIRPVETLRWSWIAAGGGWRSSLVGGLVVGLVYWLLGGLFYGLRVGLEEGLAEGLFFGLSRGLVVGLVAGLYGWILGWLAGELTGGQITRRTIADNPQLRRLVWYIVAFGLVAGLVVGLLAGLVGGLLVGLLAGLLAGPAIGLVGVFIFGLTTKDIPTRTVDSKSIRRAARGALGGGLVGGLLVGLVAGLIDGPEGGLFGALLGGMSCTPFGWLGSWLGDRSSAQQVTLENKAVRRFARNALSGALGSVLGFGLLRPLDGLFYGLLGGQVFGLLGGLLSGLVEGDITTRTMPNEGIRRSLHSAVVGGLLGGLVVGLVGGLSRGLGFWPGQLVVGGLNVGLRVGLEAGLLGGLGSGLLYGGATVLQHYTLRWLLYRNGSLPLRLVPFLDECTERIFLRKVGGGYIFVHRLLMEHFASLYGEQPPAEPVEIQRTIP